MVLKLIHTDTIFEELHSYHQPSMYIYYPVSRLFSTAVERASFLLPS